LLAEALVPNAGAASKLAIDLMTCTLENTLGAQITNNRQRLLAKKYGATGVLLAFLRRRRPSCPW